MLNANALRWLWAVGCGLWLGAAVAADEPAKPAATPAATATPATPKPADPKAPVDAKAPATQKPAGDAKAPTKDPNTPSTPQRFVPSEQVRPDFDVSFPVDI